MKLQNVNLNEKTLKLIEQVALGKLNTESIERIFTSSNATSVSNLLDELLNEAGRTQVPHPRKSPGWSFHNDPRSGYTQDTLKNRRSRPQKGTMIRPGEKETDGNVLRPTGHKTQLDDDGDFDAPVRRPGDDSDWSIPAPDKSQVDPSAHTVIDRAQESQATASRNRAQEATGGKPYTRENLKAAADKIRRPSDAQMIAMRQKIMRPVLLSFLHYLDNYMKNVTYSIGKSSIPPKRAAIVKSIADNLYKLAKNAVLNYQPTARMRTGPDDTIQQDKDVADARNQHNRFWPVVKREFLGPRAEPFKHSPIDDIQ